MANSSGAPLPWLLLLLFPLLPHFAHSLASFPSNFGPSNCTDPNEDFHQCIGICPGSNNWHDLSCNELLKESTANQSQQALQMPTGLGRPLCWSLRCFPGCRCRKGFVREHKEGEEGGENGLRAKCVKEEQCKQLVGGRKTTEAGNGTKSGH